MQEADEQICDARLALDADGITESSLSDDEDSHPIPLTSDRTRNNNEISSDDESSSDVSYSGEEDGNTPQHHPKTDHIGVVKVDEADIKSGVKQNGLQPACLNI